MARRNSWISMSCHLKGFADCVYTGLCLRPVGWTDVDGSIHWHFSLSISGLGETPSFWMPVSDAKSRNQPYSYEYPPIEFYFEPSGTQLFWFGYKLEKVIFRADLCSREKDLLTALWKWKAYCWRPTMKWYVETIWKMQPFPAWMGCRSSGDSSCWRSIKRLFKLLPTSLDRGSLGGREMLGDEGTLDWSLIMMWC